MSGIINNATLVIEMNAIELKWKLKLWVMKNNKIPFFNFFYFFENII